MENAKVKKSIIDLLLGDLRKRPAMFLERNQIKNLHVFIGGYCAGLYSNEFDVSSDPYFGENNETGFLNWFRKKRGNPFPPVSYLTFLEECNGSQEDALQLFFTLLEEYSNELKSNAL